MIAGNLFQLNGNNPSKTFLHSFSYIFDPIGHFQNFNAFFQGILINILKEF